MRRNIAARGVSEHRANLRLNTIFGVIVAAAVVAVPGQSSAAPVDTTAAIKSAGWNPAVKLTPSKGVLYLETNDIPNHPRDAYYAIPTGPPTNSAVVTPDPTQPQSWRFTIPTSPQYTAKTTAAPLGSIGVMTSGSVLFNPYEGDNTTVAMSSNFSVTNAAGITAWFIDQCAGHPVPGIGAYHYHGLPVCFASQTGPSG